MEIRMVDLATQYANIKEEIDNKIQEVIHSTIFINGPVVKEFATNLANFLDVKHVIPCGNGTDALQIALMALDLKPGDEVITTPFTFVATIETIALLQLKPVFVDVDYKTFNVDVNQIKDKITSRTRAILPVHLFGLCCDMEPLQQIAQDHNLKIIEDAAQAIGANYTNTNGNTSMAGTMGDFGTFSFFPSKNLGCYGDGGAIVTNNSELAEKAQIIAKHGSKVKYYHQIVGVNSRLDAIQAAVLDVKLKYLKSYNEHRIEAADYYDKCLNIETITTPYRPKNRNHIFHQYTLKVDGDRDAIKDYIKSLGIPSMVYYPVCLHLQPAYLYLGYKEGDFPIAEKLSKEVLSLPMHSELNQLQQDTITGAIKSFSASYA